MVTIDHAGEKWNKDYVKKLTEEEFVKRHSHKSDHNSLRKLWKIVHGFTKPNYDVKESKPKRKRKEKED